MKNKKSAKFSGQIPKRVLVFGGIIIIAILIIIIIIKITSGPPEPVTNGGEGEEEETYEPVYEAVISNIKFIFVKAEDKGRVLRASETEHPEREEDLFTKERFIKVTIGAQNIGKETISPGQWDIKEIIDEEGRVFELLGREADPWIPEQSNCGTLLKPAFSPTFCTKIYEVAKISTDLKVKVFVEEKGITGKKGEALIDLKL